MVYCMGKDWRWIALLLRVCLLHSLIDGKIWRMKVSVSVIWSMGILPGSQRRTTSFWSFFFFFVFIFTNLTKPKLCLSTNSTAQFQMTFRKTEPQPSLHLLLFVSIVMIIFITGNLWTLWRRTKRLVYKRDPLGTWGKGFESLSLYPATPLVLLYFTPNDCLFKLNAMCNVSEMGYSCGSLWGWFSKLCVQWKRFNDIGEVMNFNSIWSL